MSKTIVMIHGIFCSGEPSGAVATDVSQGVYAVTLGGGGMTAIDRLIFGNGDDLYLRVWFSEDNVTFEELLPAQRMVSHGYAVNADQVDGLDAAEIVAGASSNVTVAGDVTGPAAIQGNKITSATTTAPGVVQIAGGAGAAPPLRVLDDNDT